MELEDDWSIDGKLDQNALLISLQGAANMDRPNLYFVYPETWDFNFTPNVLEFLEDKHNYTFSRLRTVEQAVKPLRTSGPSFRDRVISRSIPGPRQSIGTGVQRNASSGLAVSMGEQ
jgi:hypothetical protein